ncbi:flagellar hook capping FlgD N-terminal domain-containing protein [Nereida sp. MMG025]|uniref:flagellar hook capping FlgD N-terminal domain-containing protein n=1 Tax=Nereida sp. MMG025 TaxID=2909981 RepID=UPI001F170C23|nr:flagellar hook capping FlgD N-terminal domain-containing protein [Nereida sp. MMG025]MCF6444694.1 flagellar hook assembly protein FlgD [Nereida sp. MMG025]
MTVTPVQTITPQYGSGTTNQGVINSDFDMFLKMLTTQVENQDPLDPVKSEDYAAQLAQFSAVEQQTKTNDLLEGLNGQFALLGMGQLAGWVGMEARVAAPVEFDGTPITIAPNPVAIADKAFLIVRDEEGTEVDRREIPVSADPFNWDGMSSDGDSLPNGVYAFSIESQNNGEVLDTIPAEVYVPITEARSQGGSTYLVIKGGALIDSAAITAIREPVDYSSAEIQNIADADPAPTNVQSRTDLNVHGVW